jgi:hypothetical protein
MSVRDVVEATLLGRDKRLVERCDVEGIVTALELYGCYGVDMLTDTLESSFAALQTQLGNVPPPFFLALLKVRLRSREASAAESTPRRAQSSTPHRASPATPSTAEPLAAAPLIPVVVTVKCNGKVIVERSSLPLPHTATWEEVARLRLGEQVHQYMHLALKVSAFPNGQQRESEQIGAAISDTVGGSFALGYPFAVLSFSAPVYGCARPPAKGADALAPMMAQARAEAGEGALALPEPYVPKDEAGNVSYELALFNAIRLQCQHDNLGVKACNVSNCRALLTSVRDALWLMAGREGSFKWGQVSLPTCQVVAACT